MIKYIFLAVFLFACGTAFATDTNLGKFNLTEKQITQTESLKSDVIKGFSSWEDGSLVVVTTRPLTPDEKSELISGVEALPDEFTDAAILQRFNPELAIAREAQIFSAEALVRLMPVSYSINELIKYRNFCGGVVEGVPYPGLKQIGEALVLDGQILESDLNTLNNILLEQGVDLGACA